MDYFDLVREYLEYSKHVKGFADGSIEAYARILRIFGQRMEIRQADDITLEVVDAFVSLRIKELQGGDGVRNIILALRSFIRFLNRKQVVSWSFELIDVPKRKRKPIQPLTAEEIQLLMANIHTERDRLLFLVLHNSGMRVGEIVNIRVEDVHGTEIKINGKGNKNRPVYIHEETADRLQMYLRLRDLKQGIVFTTNAGKPIGVYTVRNILRDAAKRAGMTRRVYPHLLRHNFAITMLQNGCDVRTIQLLMGHDQLQTTQQYLEISDQWKKSQYELHKPKLILTAPVAYGNMNTTNAVSTTAPSTLAE